MATPWFVIKQRLCFFARWPAACTGPVYDPAASRDDSIRQLYLSISNTSASSSIGNAIRRRRSRLVDQVYRDVAHDKSLM